MKRFGRLLALVLCAAVPAFAQASELPGDSLYRLGDTFTDQDGRDFRLVDLRGRPALVAMFYASCRYVCPLIIDTVKLAEHEIPDARRANLRVLIVSLDPVRDDVAALKALADRRRLDTPRWTLARTHEAGVRRLAALLGVRYRTLANGEFNHTRQLVLLDAEGRKWPSMPSWVPPRRTISPLRCAPPHGNRRVRFAQGEAHRHGSDAAWFAARIAPEYCGGAIP